ncbi:MAG TPA: hypothetical protein VFJ00_03535 [Candidatus Limnocylindria bacterium]|nr:hypothetical protein [Candidatus Limnocylindria bacterium]
MSGPAPSPSPGSRWPWLAGLVALGVGAFLGYSAAYQSSVGGLGGMLGAAFLWLAVGALAVVAGLVGIGNALRGEGRGRVASRYSFAAVGLLLAGAGGGYGAVSAFDLGYHPPVVLQARGEASITLAGTLAFVPRASGRADCQSVADGTDVERVVALSLGDLHGGLLRADFAIPVGGVSSGYISLFVDGATLASGSVPPTWEKAEPEVSSAAGGASGSIRFDGAQLRTEPEIGAATGSWPSTLSGTVTWSCGEWFAPDASPPTAVSAQVTLDLSGGDWRATGGTIGSCEFEADGSVWTVTTGDAGLLRGEPLSLVLDLGGDPRAGDEVHLWLSVHLATPSGAASLPLGALVAATTGRTISWTDLVAIDEVAPEGLSGSLTFNDVPMESTPDLAWPARLSGELSWECG